MKDNHVSKEVSCSSTLASIQKYTYIVNPINIYITSICYELIGIVLVCNLLHSCRKAFTLRVSLSYQTSVLLMNRMHIVVLGVGTSRQNTVFLKNIGHNERLTPLARQWFLYFWIIMSDRRCTPYCSLSNGRHDNNTSGSLTRLAGRRSSS